MADSYLATRDRLEDYFDRSAMRAWERLTSDAPVSRIRRTVREGRDRMRALLLGALPTEMQGLRVLDAGCGAGQMALALAERGAEVAAVDISPRLLEVARGRTPAPLRGRIDFISGDMLDPHLGRFDHVVAMDSLIHYRPEDAANALAGLAGRTSGTLVFTIAPRTLPLAAMHFVGQIFPRGDRAPAIVPVAEAALSREVARRCGGSLKPVGRVTSGFYISQAMELRP